MDCRKSGELKEYARAFGRLKMARAYFQESVQRLHGPAACESDIFGDDVPVTSQHENCFDPVRLQKSIDCDKKFEVLNHYKFHLPKQIRVREDILMRKPTKPTYNSSMASGFRRNRNTSLVSLLPKHYYEPWPQHTRTLRFPKISMNDVSELQINMLSDYRMHLQSDDSCEIGLKIIRYLRTESSALCIVPSTRVWSYLQDSPRNRIRMSTLCDDVFLQDIQRKMNPYLPCSVGHYSVFITMFIHQKHRYVLTLFECDSLTTSVTTVLENGIRNANRKGLGNKKTCVNRMEGYYRREIGQLKAQLQDVILCIEDSLCIPLTDAGWARVKEYVFFIVFNAVLTKITSISTMNSYEFVRELTGRFRVVHAAVVTMLAIEEIVWSQRIHVRGPRQEDDRSCGAYGLATVWKLTGASELGMFLSHIEKEMEDNRKSDRENHGVVVSEFGDFFSSEHVEFVMQELDKYIRSEILQAQPSLPVQVIE